MTKLTALLVPFLAIAAVPAASAQPARDDGPPVDASEPPRGRLSHINGHPIPVGDHNQYYYDTKKWNLSSNPVGWMLGFYGVSLSYAASNHVALRADVNYYSPIDSDLVGYELGVGVPIYFRRTYQGVFLEPGIILRRSWSDYDDYDDSPDTEAGPQILVGWHWTWDSGLNVAAAIGAGRDIAGCQSECEYYEENDEEPFVNGYLRFGYAF